MTTKQSPRGRPAGTNGSDTRDRILNAALEAFSERGFDGATIREIAAKVGVSDPALYSHFKSKNDIFNALMKEAGPDALGPLTQNISFDEMTARDAIPFVFEKLVASWTTPRARAFTSLMLRMGPNGISAALKEVSLRLHPVFQKWQARGEIRQDISPEISALQVFGPLAALRLSYLHNNANQADIDQAIAQAKEHLAFVSSALTTPDGK